LWCVTKGARGAAGFRDQHRRLHFDEAAPAHKRWM
jgi:hypothetical protein